MKVTFVDNFDSFTFNLVDELEKRGAEVEVWRNDVGVEQLLSRIEEAQLVVLSPGPGKPAQAGCTIELVKRAAGELPILGVCLGHQAIVEALGGEVGFAGEVVHGKAAAIHHDGEGIFAGLPSPMTVGRYHSLAALELPESLRVTARSGALVMAVTHVSQPLVGLQFHPESILTPQGGQLIQSVMDWATAWKKP